MAESCSSPPPAPPRLLLPLLLLLLLLLLILIVRMGPRGRTAMGSIAQKVMYQLVAWRSKETRPAGAACSSW